MALCVTSMGCAAHAKPVASLEGVAPGTTTLRIANDLDGEALQRVVVTIDGETLPLSALPPAGGAPSLIASLHLAPGAHAIGVRATARGASKDDLVVVGHQQPFWVSAGASSIGIQVRPVPAGGDPPVVVDVTMLGGRLDPALDDHAPVAKAIASAADRRCRSLQPIPGALCRTAADLEDAARRNDVVAALCLHDKLDEMRRLALVGDSGTPDGVQLAEARVAMVARVAERCGGPVTPIGPDGVTVTRIEP